MKPNKQFIWSSILVALMLIAFTHNASALSSVGQPCNFTGDCARGYCINSNCAYPPNFNMVANQTLNYTGACNYTADCLEGFCSDNGCVLPTREDSSVLSLGLKSGCTGIIDNCTGLLCSVCSVTWLLLIIGSAVAGFLSLKRGRLLPVIMLLVPLLLGVILIPVLGFIMSLIEILLLALLFGKQIKS